MADSAKTDSGPGAVVLPQPGAIRRHPRGALLAIRAAPAPAAARRAWRDRPPVRREPTARASAVEPGAPGVQAVSPRRKDMSFRRRVMLALVIVLLQLFVIGP